MSYSPIIGPDFTHVHCHLFTTDDLPPIAAIFLFEPTSQLSVVCYYLYRANINERICYFFLINVPVFFMTFLESDNGKRLL